MTLANLLESKTMARSRVKVEASSDDKAVNRELAHVSRRAPRRFCPPESAANVSRRGPGGHP